MTTREEYIKIVSEKLKILKAKSCDKHYLARIVADNGARIGVNSDHNGIIIETYNDEDRTIMLAKRPWVYEQYTPRNKDFLIDHMNNIIESDLEEAMYYLNLIK